MKRLLVLASLMAAAVTVRAETPKTSSTAEAEVRAAADAYIAAYNRGDAKAVADFWSDRGEWLTPDGRRIQGREAIAKELKKLFAENKGVHLELIDWSARLVTPEVAVEEGRIRVGRRGEPGNESTYIAVQVKQADGWKLDSVRETDLPEGPVVETPLGELKWLVGDWGDPSGDDAVATSVVWTKNKRFLRYAFRVNDPDGDDLEGTQIIGWDPAAGVIRSWMFDSDGGFGEGVWSKRDNRWVVKFKQVLPDGRKASATNIYTPEGNDAMSWQSIGREVDGQFLPNIGPLKVVRKSTAPAEKPADPSAADKSSADKPTAKKPAVEKSPKKEAKD